MALSSDQILAAHVAFNRFGLGARPGGIRRIGADARAAVLAEVARPRDALIPQRKLPGYVAACQVVHTSFEAEDRIKERELSARIGKQMEVEVGFVERLVVFFSNHFSMSVNKDGSIRATIGQLERDVIRKTVLGRFEDMLLGVMEHPAMLAYLDNASSIGPNSPIGKSWGVGLNMNLAREILELHTLGVGGGYGEADVAALAAIISGWSYVRGWEADYRQNGGNRRNRGQFIYRDDWHEPGAQVLLGRAYAQPGMRQGRAALSDLARHPSTAQFLAFKLVRHFLTDTPTPELVEPLAEAYRASDGDLGAMARALVMLPAAWSLPLAKLRTPYELQIAEMRALGRTYDPKERWPFSEALRALRNLPWERGPPDGYSDESTYWMGPDAMRIRLETAQLNAWALQRIHNWRRRPMELARSLFDTALSGPSRRAIAEAPDQLRGLATVFMVPEFQRR